MVLRRAGWGRHFLVLRCCGSPAGCVGQGAGCCEALEAKAASALELVQARAAKIEGKVVKIHANAGPEGKLFGSVGSIDITNACNALDLNVERSEVRLSDGPIRATGEYQVVLHLHTDVNVSITVIVEGQLVDAPIDVLDDDEMLGDEVIEDEVNTENIQ